jgi:hypothetical protein
MEIKLKLKIKDTEIELTEKEVGELRDIIKRLFPEDKQIQYVPYYPYVWSEPWKVDRWTVTYSNNTGNNTVYTAQLT